MNGEVNGVMEEPMDTSSLPDSPENTSVVKKNATDINNECEAMDVNDSSNHTANSTQPDSIAESEFSNGCTDTSTLVSSTTVEEGSKPTESSEVVDDLTQSSGYISQTVDGTSPKFDVLQSTETLIQSSEVVTKSNEDVTESTNNAKDDPGNISDSTESTEPQSNDIIIPADVSKDKDPNKDIPDQECTNSNGSTAASTGSSGTKLQDDVDMISVTNDLEAEDVGESDREKQTVSTNDESDEDDSEEDSSEDGTEDGTDGTDDGDVVKIGDGDGDEPVSIPSESEIDLHDQGSFDDSSKKGDNSDCMEMVDLSKRSDDTSDGNNGNNGTSPEVQEILSDDPEECSVVTVDPHGKLSDDIPKPSDTPIRRSSRVIKRKSYIDQENGNGESDVEEIVDDPLNHKLVQKNKTIVNDTQKLMDMAVKSMKTGTVTITQKKEPTVVIIDTNSILSGKANLPTQQNKTSYASMPTSAAAAQSLYQSIAARGTTVTPVSSKVAQSTNMHIPQQAPPTPVQAPILPSLTDDMFVVEAPSFIVPYVYEKPSVKPFREFVDTLGKELEMQNAKEEQERLLKQKEKEEIVKKEKPDEEDDKGKLENVKMDDSEAKSQVDEGTQEAATKKKDKKGRKKRNEDDDDNSWTGNSSSESDDDISEDETTKTVIIKEKEDDVLETIKDTTNVVETPPEPKVPGVKSDSYFENSLGKFFITIGMNLVQEYVQTDLLKQQKRKLQKENRSGGNTRGTESAIHSLLKNIEFSKENNAPYRFEAKKCEFCSFKTESALALAHHMETPHMKNNIYKCNFCPFEIRSPHDILYHMEAEHNIRGRLERAPAYHQCANCPFEDNGKGKLARHLIACAKKFKPELNLAPPLEWEPPAKIPKMARGRNTLMGSYQAAFGRLGAAAPVNSHITRPPVGVQNIPAAAMQNFRAQNRGRPQAPLSLPRSTSVHAAPIVRGGVVLRPTTPQVLLPANYHMLQAAQAQGKANALPSKLLHQPSISITPLPRALQPTPSAASGTAAGAAPAGKSGSFVICEICDGYIKDLEQLRNHMQWIHKVKIHPKMIYNRPPLNCQKCQFRFFTDQGLERHLLGSHGLVTSSMQEAANKGKDAGRCPVCGRVYQWKLLNHVARDHNLTLKPAHLSYKCTVCTATFGMYKQFENHVYSAHSVVAKRVIDKNKPQPGKPAAANDALLKPMKINDEITIIPQPAKPALVSTKAAVAKKGT